MAPIHVFNKLLAQAQTTDLVTQIFGDAKAATLLSKMLPGYSLLSNDASSLVIVAGLEVVKIIILGLILFLFTAKIVKILNLARQSDNEKSPEKTKKIVKSLVTMILLIVLFIPLMNLAIYATIGKGMKVNAFQVCDNGNMAIYYIRRNQTLPPGCGGYTICERCQNECAKILTGSLAGTPAAQVEYQGCLDACNETVCK